MTEIPSPLPGQSDLDAEALRNPATSAAESARTAGQRPDLYPAIAAHPSCYPDLTARIAAQDGQSGQGGQDSAAQAQPAGARQTAETRQAARADRPVMSPREPPARPAGESDRSSEVRRRSAITMLSAGIGAVAIGALAGAGTWWATHRGGSENDDQAASGPFSMSALEGAFLQGTRETWSIAEGRAAVALSPSGSQVVALRPKLAAPDFSYEPRVYPLDAGALGEPVIFPEVQTSKDNSAYSVVLSWWGGSPLIWDSVYDTSSSTSSPVPWGADSTLFVGAPGKSRAILLEVPHIFDRTPSAPPQGAMIAVDDSGEELWRTADEYVSGFFDPARSDLLIGYTRAGGGDDATSLSVTPHLLDPGTGAVRAALPPVVLDDSGQKSGGLLLASDGLVCFSKDGSAMTAEARTFDGRSAWSLTGGFAKIVFCGVPSLDVVDQSLTSWDGSTALVAENGTALVQASDGSFSLEGTGTALKLGTYDSEGAEFADLSYFTVLADGSGILTQSSEKEDSVRMIDTSTGAGTWSVPGRLVEDGAPQNQGTAKALPRSIGGARRNGPLPAGVMLIASGAGPSATVTCFAPAS